ncbi:hypothetical protein B0T24DRAFT_695352 [Lasiosphaeria ovina]|uniref:Uncharacterized protein n=1 Tax=Lasiosphaeria ovina TaxID=92902 RepID=A0AAE0NDM9_9PEZI|nr:hypothetical protein B0T24DRAFT_695352 [Lasiosphaeria ovina]
MPLSHQWTGDQYRCGRWVASQRHQCPPRRKRRGDAGTGAWMTHAALAADIVKRGDATRGPLAHSSAYGGAAPGSDAAMATFARNDAAADTPRTPVKESLISGDAYVCANISSPQTCDERHRNDSGGWNTVGFLDSGTTTSRGKWRGIDPANIAAPTVKVLYDAYGLLYTRDSVLHPLSSSEFREVVGSLETLSLISAVDGKTGSFAVLQTPGRRRRKDIFANIHGLADEKRVASCVGEKEMEQAVEGLGVGILRSILSGEALDY